MCSAKVTNSSKLRLAAEVALRYTVKQYHLKVMGTSVFEENRK